jgi:hypothetical protein
MSSDGQPEKADVALFEVAQWLHRNQVAGSALGRQVCGDHALLTRWRRGGCQAVSEEKRLLILTFIREHPKGLPGYKPQQKRKGRRKGWTAGTGKWSGKASTGEPNGDVYTPKYNALPFPAPALGTLNSHDAQDWVRAKAVETGLSISHILAEMALLGIKVTQELEYEEAHSDDTPST